MSNKKSGFEPTWGTSVFECKFCGKDGMQWKQLAPDIWIPYDLKEKKQHSCNVEKDKEYMGYQVENTGSITLESLLENLELLGFEYFVPRTSSWKFALVKSNDIQTVYFLIGRLGIDFKFYDHVRDNNTDENGRLYTDGGKMVRNYYWQSDVNIHHLILKVATQLSNNIPIENDFLTGQGRSINKQKSITKEAEEYQYSAHEFAEEYQYSAHEFAGRSNDMTDLYEAMSTGDGEDAYMGDGIWIKSDGSIYDKGR